MVSGILSIRILNFKQRRVTWAGLGEKGISVKYWDVQCVMERAEGPLLKKVVFLYIMILKNFYPQGSIAPRRIREPAVLFNFQVSGHKFYLLRLLIGCAF